MSRGIARRRSRSREPLALKVWNHLHPPDAVTDNDAVPEANTDVPTITAKTGYILDTRRTDIRYSTCYQSLTGRMVALTGIEPVFED
jgi:hypothetical protein